MRERIVLAVLTLTVLLPIPCPAQQKPDLTGTWKLNLEKSKLANGKPIPYYSEFIAEISHQEPKLRIVEKIKTSGGQGDRTVVWNVTTDGKAAEAEAADSPHKMTAAWDGNRLVTHVEGQGFTVVRKSTVAPDGKSIKAEWELTMESGVTRASEEWEKQ